MRIKVNDLVEVLSGDRVASEGTSGRGRGRVKVVDRTGKKVIVEGINRVYKHVRKTQRNPQGGRLSREMPIDWSKVMVVCPACGQPARMGSRVRDDGGKERYCKKCQAATGELRAAED